MQADIRKGFCKILMAVLGLMLLFSSFTLAAPTAVLAGEEVVLQITGDGVTDPKAFTLAQLQSMEQYQHVYSAINTWPTKKWYVGNGVKLRDLFNLAGIKEDATLIKFTSRDSFTVTLTVQELLYDSRYYFPQLKDNDPNFGHIPGSATGAEEVEPILALVSAEGNDNPDYMNDMNSLLLMMGQRAVTEQTSQLFIKNVAEIEVLTTEPEKWDNPQANPGSGEVTAGTIVKLSNARMDDDKIYYTTDGSTPTVNSPMYNWIASRWWLQRQDDLDSINHPIGITKDTTIKAITIGPGKYDSDIVTFSYQAPVAAPPALTADVTDNAVGSAIELTFADDPAWRAVITGVIADGTPLAADDYIVGESKLTIKAGVFKQAGDYAIAVQATGYEDAIVTQTIKVSSGTVEPGEDVALTITGNGVTTPVTFTLTQLKAMAQYQQVYSAINTWPTKKWYVGKGVELKDLLDTAGIKSSARQIRFTASDGFTATFTVQELLKDKRYYFPGLKDNDHYLGQIPGSSSGKKEVEPILALESAEGADDPDYMNNMNALLLMMGQRAVTEQTGQSFLKKVNRIEVLTSAPGKWDEPEADPDSGDVAPGTLVRLSSVYNDDDKIHYTTDGSNPNLDSPMYNWIASRWWSQRQDDLDSINHPIGITKDTIIKAITIGPGRENSDVATFSYKVTKGASTSNKISNSTGGTVSLGDEASIEIPAGALTNADVEIVIHKVTAPPAAPAGFKLVGSVYDFSVDGKDSYSFARSVTIKLSFDSDAISAGETPVICYYDEDLGQWVNTGGTVSGNTVTVQVDHFTKFAVMAAGKEQTRTEITSKGGTASLGSEVTIEVPANALTGTGAVEVKIQKVTAPPAAPAGFKLVGSVYDFSVNGKDSYSFARSVTIKLSFDSDAVSAGETPLICYYDEDLGQWVNIGGTVSGNTVTVQVDHFTRFAVMAAMKEQTLTDITGHWAIDNINSLMAMGAISGYPDGTFRPDHTITRAEFVSVLVQAFKLENMDGKNFNDTAGHWSEDYITTATAHGLVNGYEDGAFGPEDLITREQMAVLIVKAAELSPSTGGLQFADSDRISGWAGEAVATAARYGILNGYPGNTFQPQGSATRAEAVTVIVNALTMPDGVEVATA